MNREQKVVFSLLKEVDEICRKCGITYYLSPQLTLCGVMGLPFPENPRAGVVYMKVRDMERFRMAVQEESPQERIVESMAESKRFPGFFLYYVNQSTLCYLINEGRNYQHPGIGVKIMPLRGKIPSRPLHLLTRVQEVGWMEMCDSYGNRRGRKKILCKSLMSLFCLAGRARLGRSLYRGFCKRMDVADTPEYVLRLKKKTVYFPRHVFEQTSFVVLEGYTFLAPGEIPLYLKKYYGKNYEQKTFSSYKAGVGDMVSARVGYQEFFQEVGNQSRFIKDRIRQRRKDTFGKNKKKYLEQSWKYVKFCGDKIRLEQYYIQKKDYIQNLYKNRDYPALEDVFLPYHKTTLKCLKRQEIFVPDEEIFEIYLQTLEKTGKSSLKERVERYWK